MSNLKLNEIKLKNSASDSHLEIKSTKENVLSIAIEKNNVVSDLISFNKDHTLITNPKAVNNPSVTDNSTTIPTTEWFNIKEVLNSLIGDTDVGPSVSFNSNSGLILKRLSMDGTNDTKILRTNNEDGYVVAHSGYYTRDINTNQPLYYITVGHMSNDGVFTQWFNILNISNSKFSIIKKLDGTYILSYLVYSVTNYSPYKDLIIGSFSQSGFNQLYNSSSVGQCSEFQILEVPGTNNFLVFHTQFYSVYDEYGETLIREDHVVRMRLFNSSGVTLLRTFDTSGFSYSITLFKKSNDNNNNYLFSYIDNNPTIKSGNVKLFNLSLIDNSTQSICDIPSIYAISTRIALNSFGEIVLFINEPAINYVRMGKITSNNTWQEWPTLYLDRLSEIRTIKLFENILLISTNKIVRNNKFYINVSIFQIDENNTEKISGFELPEIFNYDGYTVIDAHVNTENDIFLAVGKNGSGLATIYSLFVFKLIT